jgi:hypothetical protein
MLAKMRNTMESTRQGIRKSILSRFPIINATELTKSSWARPVKAIIDVPDGFKDQFETLLADGKEFPYTVLAPSHERFLHKTSEVLICDFGNEIYVFERRGNACEVQCYPHAGINYFEIRTMLLDSTIRIHGVTKQGAPETSTIKFNTISDYLFTPFQKWIRLATFDSKSISLSLELEKFDYLVRQNFKFMNFAKRSMLDGESVIHLFCSQKFVPLFGTSSR